MKLRNTLAAVLCSLAASTAFAQPWPTRPLRILVGSAPGTNIDLTARMVGGDVAKRLGTSTVVENQTGAGGAIALAATAKAPADGYIMSIANISNYLLLKEPIILGRDLSAIGDVSTSPYALMVRGSLGIKNLQQLVAHAKANPGKLNFGNASVSGDFLMDEVGRKSGITYTLIRYRAGTPIRELVSGEVDMALGTLGGNVPALMQEGRIVPVLVWSKSATYPAIPTAVDQGFMPFPVSVVLGFYGAPGVPRDITQRLSAMLQTALKTPEIVEGLRKMQAEPYFTTPEQQLREYEDLAKFYLAAAKAANYAPQ
jgi:tripartite-type tricarboxylate transporter receptor subunit TctC